MQAFNRYKISIYNPSQSPKLDFNLARFIINKESLSSNEISCLSPDIYKSQFTVNASPDHLIIKVKPNQDDTFKFKSDNTPIEMNQENSQLKITLNSHSTAEVILTTSLDFPNGAIYIHIVFEPIRRDGRNVEVYKLINDDKERHTKTFISKDGQIEINQKNFKLIEETP